MLLDDLLILKVILASPGLIVWEVTLAVLDLKILKVTVPGQQYASPLYTQPFLAALPCPRGGGVQRLQQPLLAHVLPRLHSCPSSLAFLALGAMMGLELTVVLADRTFLKTYLAGLEWLILKVKSAAVEHFWEARWASLDMILLKVRPPLSSPPCCQAMSAPVSSSLFY